MSIKSKCFSLANHECANNLDGWCAPMDCPCFAYVPLGGVCTYFLDAVLPLQAGLQKEVLKKLPGPHEETGKRCVCCGETFHPASNRQKYCRDCARQQERINNAKRIRRFRNPEACNALEA